MRTVDGYPEIEMTKGMSAMLVYMTNENNKGDFIIDDRVGTWYQREMGWVNQIFDSKMLAKFCCC